MAAVWKKILVFSAAVLFCASLWTAFFAPRADCFAEESGENTEQSAERTEESAGSLALEWLWIVLVPAAAAAALAFFLFRKKK